eukprot:gene5133-43685_t
MPAQMSDIGVATQSAVGPRPTALRDRDGRAKLGMHRATWVQCHCGGVHFEVTGKPAMGVATALRRAPCRDPARSLCAYKTDNMREDRYFCKECGGKVYSMLNHIGCKAVFLQNLTSPNHGADGKIDPRFAMDRHIFYGSGTVCVYDKLEKFETLPKCFGGDGKLLPNEYHLTKPAKL